MAAPYDSWWRGHLATVTKRAKKWLFMLPEERRMVVSGNSRSVVTVRLRGNARVGAVARMIYLLHEIDYPNEVDPDDEDTFVLSEEYACCRDGEPFYLHLVITPDDGSDGSCEYRSGVAADAYPAIGMQRGRSSLFKLMQHWPMELMQLTSVDVTYGTESDPLRESAPPKAIDPIFIEGHETFQSRQKEWADVQSAIHILNMQTPTSLPDDILRMVASAIQTRPHEDLRLVNRKDLPHAQAPKRARK